MLVVCRHPLALNIDVLLIGGPFQNVTSGRAHGRILGFHLVVSIVLDYLREFRVRVRFLQLSEDGPSLGFVEFGRQMIETLDLVGRVIFQIREVSDLGFFESISEMLRQFRCNGKESTA